MSQQLLTSQKIDELLKFVTTLPNCSESKLDEETERFYITTAINYTNGRPHIGHAYEAVTSDVIARYHRIYGRNVFFLTGTDEHGQKVANTAASKGKEPKAFCDENVAVFKELNELLCISNDYYVRTTDTDHYALASKMFGIAYANGDIYKSQYEGWYDVRNERFLTETQAKETNYLDPTTKKAYTKQSEETYFFRMSKYQRRLLSHIESHPQFISPDKSHQLILRRLLDSPLEDLCVSRSTFDWGIPVPIDSGHIIYVWFDALSNYLTGIKYFDDNSKLSAFWPANVHIIGKDIVWFHCVIWPCILMSCGIELPQRVFCHGFVMDAKGEKMSKSVGNVVDPFRVLKKYKSDSLRYFICTQTRFGSDMRWNDSDLQKRHDAHLAHIYGNLVNRALKLCHSKTGGNGKIPEASCDVAEIFNLNELMVATEAAFAAYDLSSAAQLAMDALRACNDWIAKKEPWKMKKKSDESEKLKIIRCVLECVYILSHFMEPFTPNAAQQVFNDLNHARVTIPQLLSSQNNLLLKSGVAINKSTRVLFVQHSSKFERKLENENKPIIARVSFVIGEIVSCELHPSDDRLYCEMVDCGDAKGPRSIVSGLAKHYPNCEQLIHSKVIVFANLKSSKFKGVESQGMVMCATNQETNRVQLLTPPSDAQVGDTLIWQNSNDYAPDEKINIGKRNSFWKKQIINKLRTDKNGNMAFDNVPFTIKSAATGEKQLISSPFCNAQIS